MYCTYKYNSKFGDIYITANEHFVSEIKFFSDKKIFSSNKLTIKTVEQLNEYFNGSRTIFDLPLQIEGTAFQKCVWKELTKIPYGEIRTYKDIARATGRINALRAVGNANNKNKLAIVIPCHRVIGSNGNLTGYSGGLELKQKLLKLEHEVKLFTQQK